VSFLHTPNETRLIIHKNGQKVKHFPAIPQEFFTYTAK
jgi:hypothetical protein